MANGTTSFAKRTKNKEDEAAEVPTEVVEDKKEVATQEKSEVATQENVAAVGGIEGEVEAGDIKLPRMNLVQPTSKIADEFTPGTLVLNKEFELGDEEHPVSIVTLWGRKLYQQKLPFGESDEAPKVYGTRVEVKASGGTTDYSQEAIDDHRYYENMAHFVCAVKCPEGASDEMLGLFELELGDELWTQVAFTVNGSSYTAFGRDMITASQAEAKRGGGLWCRAWEIKPEKRGNTKGRWHVPVPRFKGRISDETRAAFFADLAAPLNNL